MPPEIRAGSYHRQRASDPVPPNNLRKARLRSDKTSSDLLSVHASMEQNPPPHSARVRTHSAYIAATFNRIHKTTYTIVAYSWDFIFQAIELTPSESALLAL